MKTIFKAMVLSAAVFGFASCADDDDYGFDTPSENNNYNYNGGIVFNAGYCQPQDESLSKTYISGSSVMFSGSEQVAIYSDLSSQANTFSARLSGNGDGSSAQFTGSIDTAGVETFFATMPVSAAKDFSPSKKTFTVNIPKSQAPTANSCDPDAQVMVSATSKDRMSFYFMNVCSYVKFTITDEVKSVALKSLDNSTSISGNVTVDEDGNVLSVVSDSTNRVTTGSLSAGTYYIAILPCVMDKGFAISFTDKYGHTITKTCSKQTTFSRAKIKNLGKVVIPNYFRIYTKGDVTIKASNHGSNSPKIEYAINDYTKFQELPSDGVRCTSTDTVYLRGDNAEGLSHSASDYTTIVLSRNSYNHGFFKYNDDTYNVGGNIMSLVDNIGNETSTIPCDYCFYHLFYDGKELANAPSLPFTSLKAHCYDGMFYGCSSITSAPSLPASTLEEGCYQDMFYNCTSLTSAPDLMATALVNDCYKEMFYKCTSLRSIKVGFHSWSDDYTKDWFMSVATIGTFYGPSELPHGFFSTHIAGSRIPFFWTFEGI